MAERNERSVLNHIMETCKDAERGYRHAADQVISPIVRMTFLTLAEQRERFAEELLPHAQRLGGYDAGDGTAKGTLHRSWMTLRGVLTHDHDDAIITEAVRGERAAIAAYEEALEGLVPPSVLDIIERQYAEVCESTKRVREFLIN